MDYENHMHKLTFGCILGVCLQDLGLQIIYNFVIRIRVAEVNEQRHWKLNSQQGEEAEVVNCKGLASNFALYQKLTLASVGLF